MSWAPPYLTLAEFKSYKRVESLDTTDDAEFNIAIEAASRAIDLATNRQFGQVTAAEIREYEAIFDIKRRHWIIPVDDFMVETGLTINLDLDDDLVFDDPIDDFKLFPFNAEQKNEPWEDIFVRDGSSNFPTRVRNIVQVNAQWGWTSIPDTIKEATFIQADRFFTRRVAPFGVAGSPEIGSEVRLLSRIDPDVKVAVSPYKRWYGAI